MTYRPIHTSISLPLSTIQRLASSRTVVPPTTKESDCTKKPILNRQTPKISSQKAEVKRWLFTKNKKVEVSEKNTENKLPRNKIVSTSGVKRKTEVSTEKKNGRVITVNSSNVTLRRGQTSNKLDGQIHTPESLSRSSSITNLNVVDQTTPKVKGAGTKPRKSASRDKLDKIGTGTGTTERRNERKGVTKNNNKFDSGDTALALDSLQEIESLRAQLHQMATEKSNLALELGEHKGHIHTLQHQIDNLKMYQEQSNLQLEQLTEENTALRNRLRDVAHSPLSDNEKQQLLYESHRHHNSAPASIATNPLEDGTCGDVTACPTPDWDKHSSSNVSEVSVACLQDKINQMQETHYSTNEELQATLQELTDLQKQLTELQQENERLSEEKNLMFDSLCRQTERLKDTRQEVENLKALLYREKNEPGVETAQEREEKLVDLLKSAQDEHESLLSKHEQMSVELQELRDANEALHEQLKVLTDRNVTLESTLDAKHAEHKLLDQELALAKDQSSGRQIEINRLKDLLENARTKIGELEQDRALSDKSELDELLDNARKEKDSLESEVTHLREQLARSKNEIEKLKEQVSILQEECKVTRNNARTIQSDLEYKCEKLVSEKTLLTDQLHNFQDVINELQVQAQCQVEDKRNLSDVLAETQRNLSESERRIISLQNELSDVKKLRKDENEEWEKFQNDLLTSVRVANDFKTEAQQDLQKMIMENKEHRDKVRQLEAQLDKLKGESSNPSGMPEERRNSQPLSKHLQQRHIFGSLPNILDSFGSEKYLSGKKMKRLKGTCHQKQLSLEEGKILDTLDRMYKEIDPNTPEDQLTTEQVVIRKLKTLYEDESVSYKPVAPRDKGDLAISKPLLESVYSNPKLETIAKNPDIKCLETDRFSWLGLKKFTDDELETPEASPRISSSHKGENRTTFRSNDEQQFHLKRYSSKEDLSELLVDEKVIHKSLKKKIAKKRSSLKSSHSGSSSYYSQKKRVSFDEKRNSCFLIKEFLTHESLEDIYRTIDPKVPEQQLTKEQRFALRVKTSCYNLGEKSELRKRHTFKKNKVTISLPTQESVLRNTKLRSIINDPIVRTVGENAEEQETVELRNLKRMRKYLADTNVVLRNSKQDNFRSNYCKNDPRISTSMEDIGKRIPFRFDRIYSSMENLPSDRMDEFTDSALQIDVTTNVLPAKSFASSFLFSSSSSSVDNSVENIMEHSGNTTVVFAEHFEPEKVEVRKSNRVEIREISLNSIMRDSQLNDDELHIGRISFPRDNESVDTGRKKKIFSIDCVEINDQDENVEGNGEFEMEKHTSDHTPEEEKQNPIAEIVEKKVEEHQDMNLEITHVNQCILNAPIENNISETKYIRPAKSFGSSFASSSSSYSVENNVENLMDQSGNTTVVFAEHFEPEKVEIRKNNRVEIREISVNSIMRDSQLNDDELPLGKISFPHDNEVVDTGTKKKIFSVSCVKLNDQHENVDVNEVFEIEKHTSDLTPEEEKQNPIEEMVEKKVEEHEDMNLEIAHVNQYIHNAPNENKMSETKYIRPAKSFGSSFASSSSSYSVDNNVENLMDQSGNTTVVFVEHFEPEKVEVRKNNRVEIREISVSSIMRDSQLTDDESHIGRISFLNEDEVFDNETKKKIFSISCVEINDQDENVEGNEEFEMEKHMSDHIPEEEKQNTTEKMVEKKVEVHPDMNVQIAHANNCISDNDNDILEAKHIYFSVGNELGEGNSTANPNIPHNDHISNEKEYPIQSFGYLPNRISDISCESWEGEERKEVKARYEEVVREIKRKYSFHRPSDTSDEEEEINIFSPNEGTIEVIKSNRENGTTDKSSLDTFNMNSEIFSQDTSCSKDKNNRNSKKSFWEMTFSNTNEKTLEDIDESVPLGESEFIRYVRQVYVEDFKDIDDLGYVHDENYPKESEELDDQNGKCESSENQIVCSDSKITANSELLPLKRSSKNAEHLLFDIVEQDSEVISETHSKNQSILATEALGKKGKKLVNEKPPLRISAKTNILDSNVGNRKRTSSTDDSGEYCQSFNQNFNSEHIERIDNRKDKEVQTFFKINPDVSQTMSCEYMSHEIPESKFCTDKINIIDKEAEVVSRSKNELPREDETNILHQLSKSELDLVSSLYKRNSRPVSAINIDDITFIEAMKNKYLNDENFKDTEHSDEFLDAVVEDTNVIFEKESGQAGVPLNTKYTLGTNNDIVEPTPSEGNENDCDKMQLVIEKSRGVSEIIDEFLMNERKNHLPSFEIFLIKSNQINYNKTDKSEIKYIETTNEILTQSYSGKNNTAYSKDDGNHNSQYVSKKELIISAPKISSELKNEPVITSYQKKNSNVRSSTKDQLDRASIEYNPYEPVYENYYELKKRELQNYVNLQRKPKPLPRTHHPIVSDEQINSFKKSSNNSSIFNSNRIGNISVKPESFDYVNSVKIETESHDPLPNYSEVMDRTDDIIEMKTEADNSVGRCLKTYSNTTKLLESLSKTDIEVKESTSEFVSDTLSSNILIRKTKKFIKDGNLMEEFDETAGRSNVELENLHDFEKFDTSKQLIPEDLIDYADGESKVTLLTSDSKETSQYFEPCSRPQTSRQASTSFRLSCYGENSHDSVNFKIDATPRNSKDMVAQLKEKFENLTDDNNEPKRSSVIMREYAEARKSNLPKLFKERDTYDLVFKTNSKYWFDNNSELEKSNATIQQSTPSFEPSTSSTPLNITILDPVESKTNTSYQHLFESDHLSTVHKPFVEPSQLSELNLKTSIPCVDFTTLPVIEKGSNASLYDFDVEREPHSAGKSDGEKIGRFTKKKPT